MPVDHDLWSNTFNPNDHRSNRINRRLWAMAKPMHPLTSNLRSEFPHAFPYPLDRCWDRSSSNRSWMPSWLDYSINSFLQSNMFLFFGLCFCSECFDNFYKKNMCPKSNTMLCIHTDTLSTTFPKEKNCLLITKSAPVHLSLFAQKLRPTA